MEDNASLILNYLERLVLVPGISDTVAELATAEEIMLLLKEQPFFQTCPQLCGASKVEGDSLQRTLPFGLVKGSSGIHYGPYQDAAFDMEKLRERLLQSSSAGLGADAWADLQSGEWLFGRGTADMKGGLARAWRY